MAATGQFIRVSTLLLAGSSVVACAGLRSPERAPFESAGRVITAQEIEKSGARNAWEALKSGGMHLSFREDSRGNPVSMTYRGRSSLHLSPFPLLLVDGTAIDHFDYLRDIPAWTVASIRVLDGVEATRYFGTGAGNGAIVVATKANDE